MRRKPKRAFLLAVSAAGLLSLLAWYLLSGTESPETATMQTQDAGNASKPAAHTSPVAAVIEDSARTRIADESKQTPAASPAAVGDVAAANELRGRVVDASDQPVAEARVSLRRGDVREFTVLDLELNRATELLAEVTTDATGEFRFELERGKPVDLHVEAAQLCPVQIPDRHAGEFVLVRLSAGYRVFGRVKRARDGAPVALAQVRAFKMGGPSPLERKTLTAGNGSFELRLSFSEGVTIEVVPQLEQCPDWIKVTLDAAGQAELDVVVEDGLLVTGKVTAASDGHAIAGAIVGEGWVYRRSATTDANGEYRLPGFGDRGMEELFAKARGFGEAKRQDLPGALDGVLRVDFQLPPARRAHGRVVDSAGSPLGNVLAAAIASDDGPQGQRTDWISSRTDISGRFEIENLTSDLRHALLLSKHGFATYVFDFPAAELASDDLDLGSFVLGLPALLAGVVEDDAGQGLAETEVVLKGNNSDRFRLVESGGGGQRGIGDWYTDSRATRTDARGNFSFGDLAPGSYSLRARKKGRPDSSAIQVTLTESERKEGVRLLLAAGARLAGRVLDPEGNAVPSVYVNAWPVQLRDPAGGSDSRPSTRSDAQGNFELLGLRAGDYRLDAWAPTSPGIEVDAPLLSGLVERVSTDASDLRIVLPRGATIRGSLRDAKGLPLFGYSIRDKNQKGTSGMNATDANGEFCLPVPSGSSCDLEVHAPQPNWNQVLLVEPGVAAGTRGLRLVLP